MSSFLIYTSLAIGGIALMLGVAYLYFVYSPVPNLPVLSTSVQEKAIQSGGHTRTYLAYVPANLPPNPALLLVLHGSNIDGKTIRKWTGYAFDEFADRYGFIVLYPDGYKNNWNDYRKTASFPARKENIDDVGFLRTLVAQFKVTNSVDPARVFVFGYSNGGQMALRLSIQQPRFVAAIAAIAANMPTQETFEGAWQGATPPVMLVSNTADNIVPYQGGEVKLFGTSRGMVLSSRATAEHFAGRNGLTQKPIAEKITSAAGANPLPVELLTWSNTTRPVVKWYTVTGGGHVVPQARFRFPRLNGSTATNLDSPAQAVAFFGLSGPSGH